jgi:hypothetical protein
MDTFPSESGYDDPAAKPPAEPKKARAKAKKPAVKKKPAKKAKKAKAAKKAKKPAKLKPKAPKKPAKKASKPAGERTERLDLRLGRKDKAKLYAKAKAARRTVTSIVVELIERMK